ncbi:MAG: aminopeptidase, partial [Caulobacteraceae bacterium]
MASFEFRQQLRSPLFWISTAVFFLLVFGALTSDRIHIGDTGNVHKNAPFAIVQTHLLMALFFMFASTAFVAGAVVRDDEIGFGPILRAAPLGKADYLFGRFAGAFAAAAVCFLAVPAAIVVGEAAPRISPESLGPPRPDALLLAYGALALPGVFLVSAVLFAVATACRSMVWTFVALVALVMAYTLAAISLDRPELQPLLARWDPFGLFTFDAATRYWTAADRNTLLPSLTGVLGINRLMCVGAGFGALAAAYPLFRFRDRATKQRSRRDGPRSTATTPADQAPRVVKTASPRRVMLAQLLASTRFDLRQVLRGPVFWILLGLGLLNSAGALWEATDDARYGGALLPVTRMLLPVLEGSFEFFAMIVAAFYAGELVWRDRERRMDEVVDATAAPDWTFVLPKTAAVILALLAALAVSVLAAMLIQAAKGYHNFQIGEYLLWWVAPEAVDLAVLAVLAIFLQTISPNKLWGWGAITLYIVARFAVPGVGLEHNLILYGTTNPVPLSDMNGQGRFWIGAWWFRLYWAAWAGLLLIAANALWRRGAERGWPSRLAEARRRMSGPALRLAVVALLVATGAGGWIAFNTLVLNRYQTQAS